MWACHARNDPDQHAAPKKTPRDDRSVQSLPASNAVETMNASELSKLGNESSPIGAPRYARKTVSLALRGGGSHEAFTWACLIVCSRMGASRSAISGASAVS